MKFLPLMWYWNCIFLYSTNTNFWIRKSPKCAFHHVDTKQISAPPPPPAFPLRIFSKYSQTRLLTPWKAICQCISILDRITLFTTNYHSWQLDITGLFIEYSYSSQSISMTSKFSVISRMSRSRLSSGSCSISSSESSRLLRRSGTEGITLVEQMMIYCL